MTRRRGLAGGLTAALASVLGLVAAPAPADPTLAPIENLSRPQPFAFSPDVAVDRQGNAVAVWVNGSADRLRVRASRLPRDGSWTTPVTLSPRNAGEAVVGVDRSGDAVAVWTTGHRVQAASRRAGGSWERSVSLSRPVAGMLPMGLDVAVNGAGRVLVVWQLADDDEDAVVPPSRVQAVHRSPAGLWGRPVTLSRRDAHDPRAAVSGRGHVMAVWQQQRRTWFVERPAGGFWQPPVPVSSAGTSASDLAVGRRGRAVVAWTRPGAIQVVRQSFSGRWLEPRAVSSRAVRAGRLDLAANGAGEITVAWSTANGAVRSAYRSSGRWHRPVTVAGAGSLFEGLELAMNRAGDAVLVWGSVRGGHHPAQVAYRSRSGSWRRPAFLSPRRGDTFGPVVAIRRSGDAVMAWVHARERSRIQARELNR